MALTAARTSDEFTTGEIFHPSTENTFSPIPNWLLRRSELSPGAKLTYGRLSQYAGKSGAAFPKLPTLAAELGVSERTVSRHIRELESFNLIQTERRGLGRSNRYHFITHIWMMQDQAGPVETEPETGIHDHGNSESDKGVMPDKTDMSGHTFKRKKEENNSNKAAVALSLPDKNLIDDCLLMIPESVTVTDGIQRTVKAGIAKYGTDQVKRNIGYSVGKSSEIRDFRAYLAAAIRGDFGIDWTPPEDKPEPPKIELHPGARVRWTDGKEYQLDRGGFLFVGGGCIPTGAIIQAIQTGAAEIVD